MRLPDRYVAFTASSGASFRSFVSARSSATRFCIASRSAIDRRRVCTNDSAGAFARAAHPELLRFSYFLVLHQEYDGSNIRSNNASKNAIDERVFLLGYIEFEERRRCSSFFAPSYPIFIRLRYGSGQSSFFARSEPSGAGSQPDCMNAALLFVDRLRRETER